MSPRRIKRLQPDHMSEPACQIYELMVPKKDWIEMPYDTAVTTAKDWIENQRQCSFSCNFGNESILVLMDGDDIYGVTEVGDLMA